MEPLTKSNIKPRFIFILGPPGSGKGTLCKSAAVRLVTATQQYFHLSVGDYLRELSSRIPKTKDEAVRAQYAMISNSLRRGELLPAEVLIPVLQDQFTSMKGWHPDLNVTWLIDGFPRDMETTLAFERMVGKPEKVITLECRRDIVKERFLRRRRETIDDEARFDKRYSEYVKNMNTINEHYAGIMDFIRVDGDREQCLTQFMEVLRQINSD